MSAGPVNFKTVLTAELDEIQQSRERRKVQSPPATSSDPYARAHEAQMIGLAFSGGGIRSATFNLGILQTLGEMGMLRWIDYLSTVSGGGYIGAWLGAWIKRAKFTPPSTPLEEVQTRLSPRQSTLLSSEPVNPIHFLREYSNYLTPRLGFFGADTWTMISIYLRNVILNQAILISAIAAALLVPRFASWPFESMDADDVWVRMVSPVALSFAMAFICRNLLSATKSDPAEKPPFCARQGCVQVLIVMPVLIATYFSSLGLWQYAGTVQAAPGLLDFISKWRSSVIIFGVLLALTGFFGTVRRSAQAGRLPAAIGFVLMASVLPAAFGGLMLWCLARLFYYLTSVYGGVWHAVAWGPPIMIALFSLTAVLHLGLMGINFPDSSREWWSRLGAWLCIYMLGWASLAAVVIYGPLVLALAAHSLFGARALTGASLAWVATTVAGLLSGKSASTNGETNGSRWQHVLARVAPYVFITGLLVAISTALQIAVLWNGAASAGLKEFQFFEPNSLSATDIIRTHFEILNAGWGPVLITLAALIVVTCLLAWRVDINEFSMHHFYRNRLIRCYLGASHLRDAQAFTGFDSTDDFPLADLAGPNFTGPYPLINATLNLERGEDLAWQQRKGASFIFTPKFCGYQISGRLAARGDARPEVPESLAVHGYRATTHYAYPGAGGISLGTAMAISGAAASPNEGYHSSPATAFLMTLFDVRLGWWLSNPARKKYDRSAPKFALIHLMLELFGMASQKRNFVYLSDGGHFENLGIYELVRRRCRYIIACDADQDAGLTFEDLGNAIRKCRADMGIDIDIDVDSIRRQPTGLSRSHCAVGTIHYEVIEKGATSGTLVYIKASLTGDETADVLSYQSRQADFPHQSTADQWYDESRFESYRKLGCHAALATFGVGGLPSPDQNGMEAFFKALRQAH